MQKFYNEEYVVHMVKNALNRQVTTVAPVFMLKDELFTFITPLINTLLYGKPIISGNATGWPLAVLVFSLKGRIVFTVHSKDLIADGYTPACTENILFDQVYFSDSPGAGAGTSFTEDAYTISDVYTPALLRFYNNIGATAQLINVTLYLADGSSEVHSYNALTTTPFVVNDKAIVAMKLNVAAADISNGESVIVLPIAQRGWFVESTVNNFIPGTTEIKVQMLPVGYNATDTYNFCSFISEYITDYGYNRPAGYKRCRLTDYTSRIDKMDGEVTVLFKNAMADVIEFAVPVVGGYFTYSCPNAAFDEVHFSYADTAMETNARTIENNVGANIQWIDDTVSSPISNGGYILKDLYESTNYVVTADAVAYGTSLQLVYRNAGAVIASQTIAEGFGFQIASVTGWDTVEVVL